jgi:hypothetical protein
VSHKLRFMVEMLLTCSIRPTRSWASA